MDAVGRDVLGIIVKSLRACDTFALACSCRAICRRLTQLRVIQHAEARFRSRYGPNSKLKGLPVEDLCIEMLGIPIPVEIWPGVPKVGYDNNPTKKIAIVVGCAEYGILQSQLEGGRPIKDCRLLFLRNLFYLRDGWGDVKLVAFTTEILPPRQPALVQSPNGRPPRTPRGLIRPGLRSEEDVAAAVAICERVRQVPRKSAASGNIVKFAGVHYSTEDGRLTEAAFQLVLMQRLSTRGDVIYNVVSAKSSNLGAVQRHLDESAAPLYQITSLPSGWGNRLRTSEKASLIKSAPTGQKVVPSFNTVLECIASLDDKWKLHIVMRLCIARRKLAVWKRTLMNPRFIKGEAIRRYMRQIVNSWKSQVESPLLDLHSWLRNHHKNPPEPLCSRLFEIDAQARDFIAWFDPQIEEATANKKK